MPDPSQDPASPRWLLLVHQIPAQPSKLRVKAWRRLQGVGAVAVKNSVYVLPNHPEAREDFEWIRGEIVAQGGEAMVFTADVLEELSAGEIVDAFVAARRGDWDELRQQAAELYARYSARVPLAAGEHRDLGRELQALRGRSQQIDKIDYFPTAGRQDALDALDALGRLLDPGLSAPGSPAPGVRIADYQGRRWLTRPRPGVDRMASAWLIRRFIDPEAEFRFADRIPPDQEVIPFDMFGVELGHQGERCTFETILLRFGLAEPALQELARMVHDLDLRADLGGAQDTVTVGRIVDGLRQAIADDRDLLAHGMAVFEALYRSFASLPATGPGKSGKVGPRTEDPEVSP